MRIALAQTNPTIGDIAANRQQIEHAINRARDQQAQLVVFPELTVIGYPPKDLLLSPDVIDQCVGAVNELAARCTDIAAIIGFPCPSDQPRGLTLYNAAAFCADGHIVHRHVKTLLPTYDVFDEQRYFEPAENRNPPYAYQGVQFGLTICEDLWNDQDLLPRRLYHREPIRRLAQAGADVLVNCSASPFVMNKHDLRIKLAEAAAKRHGLPVLYCNQVGGNDELVFDGNSFAVDRAGRLIGHARDFECDLLVVDLDIPKREGRSSSGSRSVLSPARPSSAEPDRNDEPDEAGGARIQTPKPGIEAAYHALVLGLRDYCRKCEFESVAIGLSGGIDSAVTCVVSVAALGPQHVRGVSMPSRYSSDGSKDDAAELAEKLGIQYHVIPIEKPHLAFEDLLEPFFEQRPPDIAEQNIQARIRGVILMALSNKFGSLLVTTGNKSELAVGYCTLYGDMCGGLAVLSDVPKTMVWDMAHWINESPRSPLRQQFGGPVIPGSTIEKAPSAELCPNQTDQDSLPPYDRLDQIIERYVELEQPAHQIITQTGIDVEEVHAILRMIDRNEYKRKQAAPGLKITGRAFGFGRRMPIAHRYDSRMIPVGEKT